MVGCFARGTDRGEREIEARFLIEAGWSPLRAKAPPVGAGDSCSFWYMVRRLRGSPARGNGELVDMGCTDG